MGQFHSSRHNRNKDNIDMFKNTFAKLDEENLGVTTRSCLCAPKKAKKGPDYRQFALQQLNQLDLVEWPAILIRHLNEHQDSNADEYYRSKIVSTNMEKSNKPKSKSNENSFDGTQSRNNNDRSSINKGRTGSPVVHSRTYKPQEMDEDELNDSIQQILESSALLKEQLFPNEYPEAKRSQTNRNPSLIVLEGGSAHANDHRVSEELSSSSSLITNQRFSAYKNNTVLNQIGPAYRTGIQNGVLGYRMSDMQEAILYYKKVTSIIEEQLKEEGNIFCQLLRLFEEYFSNSYGAKIKEIKTGKMPTSEIRRLSEVSTNDLQQFIKIMCHSVNMFYNLQSLKGGRVNSGYTVFNYDNISNFMTTMIFTEKIYKIIYNMYKLEDKPVEKDYRKHLKHYRTFLPEDFGVDAEYCLNRKTVSFLENKVGSRDRLVTKVEKGRRKGTVSMQELETNTENDNDVHLISHRETIKVKHVKIEVEEEGEKSGQVENSGEQNLPYERSIHTLKQLHNQRSPIHKLKIVMKVVDSITSSIDDFYKDFEVKNQKDFGGDQNFSIFCYIVGQSKVKNLLAHCKIIQNFSTCNVMCSVSGYYTATLEAAARYISTNPKDVKLLSKKETVSP